MQEFTAKDGYGLSNTRFLKRDSRGWIWREATDGIYVSNGNDVTPGGWLHITMQNGLATGSCYPYGFFEDNDGSVWISGEQGITHVNPGETWFEAPRNVPAPSIIGMEVDGRVFVDRDLMPAVIDANPRLLRLNLESMNALPFRDYPIRYRLLPSMTEWHLSHNGILEFRDRVSNTYRIEVEYAGIGSTPIRQFGFWVGPRVSTKSRLWVLALIATLTVETMVSRQTPRFEKLRYRMQKALFLLRRRLEPAKDLDAGASQDPPPDYTGKTLLGRYQLVQSVSRGDSRWCTKVAI